ncbi:SusC/RagA family TonB-linked outer membrane protein [Hymenobacter perfusus]|uniref:TonB-dependent receptor n=1 Tax=Hymenobacter perfusus TaxID=1236770 RepID=A0A3R9N191_9BACT|nr:TonB-dependent receptor [Hymenobacter perfusus]RSK45691.1 TonB-dependent receptor [Hymenobacter perfusus]
MKHKYLIPLSCGVLFAATAAAQTRTVSGRVTDAAGTGLPGVTVLERGTSNGTSTATDGSFTLSVQPGATLVLSSIGFETQNLVVGDRTSVAATLKTAANELGEAVVVGYGTQTKRELTGAVTQLGSKDVENVPTVSFEQAIQGRTPGVQINQGSGKLGAGVQIRVRGSSSISASNQPLYVIDGIPVTSQDLGLGSSEPINPLADLNPNDIENITVLKDAASAAIYGSRGSNGVILVTTKKGRQGTTRVNVGAYFGTSKATRIRKFLNASEYRELFTESINYGLTTPGSILREDYGFTENDTPQDVFSYFAGSDFDANNDTPWNELAFRKGQVMQYDANVSGGDAKTRFYLSASYNDQKGIIIGNRYRRGSIRTNLDHSISEKVKVGINFSLTRSMNDRVADDNAFTNPLQLNAMPPMQSPYNAADPTGFNRSLLYENALVASNRNNNQSGNYRILSNVFLSYEPIKGLILRSEFGGDILNLREEQYYSRFTNDAAGQGYGYSNQVQAVNYTTNNTATWLKTFGTEHTLEALGGFTFQRFDQDQTAVEGQGFPNDNFRRIASAARFTSGSGSSGTGYSFVSLLSRVNYTFRNRYLASVSVRADASSRFGRDNRWGYFPAGSLGWVLSDEAFLQDNAVISLIKLRASYGVTGNAEIGNFSSRTLYAGSQYDTQPGIIPLTTLGNNELTWENTRQANLGLDFGFFNDRITGEVDVYQKNTTDLLLNQQLPLTGGYQLVTRNLGKLNNKGLEVSVNTRNIDKEFKWSTNFNISFNRNKVTDLEGQELVSGSRNLGRVREGEPIGVFWGREYAGVDPENGDALYYLNTSNADGSLNRSTTNLYNSAANVRLGNPNPKFTGGLSNTWSYKGFELNLLTQFTYGNDLYNIAGLYQSANGDYFDNQTVDQLKRWQKAGDITDVPQARLLEGNGTGASSRWIQDGSFFRFKNLTLAYNLPKTLTSAAGMQNVRVYVTGQNLITITNYTGYDPEVNTSGLNGAAVNYLLGHDFYTPPLAKTWLVGINVGF